MSRFTHISQGKKLYFGIPGVKHLTNSTSGDDPAFFDWTIGREGVVQHKRLPASHQQWDFYIQWSQLVFKWKISCLFLIQGHAIAGNDRFVTSEAIQYENVDRWERWDVRCPLTTWISKSEHFYCVTKSISWSDSEHAYFVPKSISWSKM